MKAIIKSERAVERLVREIFGGVPKELIQKSFEEMKSLIEEKLQSLPESQREYFILKCGLTEEENSWNTADIIKKLKLETDDALLTTMKFDYFVRQAKRKLGKSWLIKAEKLEKIKKATEEYQQALIRYSECRRKNGSRPVTSEMRRLHAEAGKYKKKYMEEWKLEVIDDEV